MNLNPTDEELTLLLAACGLRMPRELQPCGTTGAYRRHLKRGERPCEPCTTANREAGRRLKDAPHTRLRPIRHGTAGGADTHRWRNEQPCRPCAEAYRKYLRDRYARRHQH